MRVFTVHLPLPRAAGGVGAMEPGRSHDFRLRQWRGAGVPPAEASSGSSTPGSAAAAEPGTAPTAPRRDAPLAGSGPDHAAAVATANAGSVPVGAVEPGASTAAGVASPWAPAPPRGSMPVMSAAPYPPQAATAPDPAGDAALSPAALRELRLVPEGFSLWAFVFGPFWFLCRGLWLATLLWMVLATVLIGLCSAVPVLAPSTFWVSLALFLLTGFHARDAERWTLHRRGLRERGVVLGLDEEDALLRLGLRAGRQGAPPSRAEEVGA